MDHWHVLNGTKETGPDGDCSMTIISTGHPSTLGTYRTLASALWGEDSDAVAYLDDRIAESPNGADEGVIADETQMLVLLAQVEYQTRPVLSK